LFTALTEDRPYRDSISKEKIINILIDLVVRGHIDNKYVDLVVRHYDQLREENLSYQRLAYNDFHSFEESINIDQYLMKSKKN
jgi:HD-GYP domain-containing protein (c-di-GMP phosphodiesterase class II)